MRLAKRFALHHKIQLNAKTTNNSIHIQIFNQIRCFLFFMIQPFKCTDNLFMGNYFFLDTWNLIRIIYARTDCVHSIEERIFYHCSNSKIDFEVGDSSV